MLVRNRQTTLVGGGHLESEERIRILVEGVRDYAIFMLDPDGNVVSWNAGAQHIKGYTAEEIIGQNFARFYLPEDIASGVPAAELAAAADGGRSEVERWRVRKNGSRFLANVVITAHAIPAATWSGSPRSAGT